MKTTTRYAPVAEAIENINNAINRGKINKVLNYCKEHRFYAILEDDEYYTLFIDDLKSELDDEEILKDHYLKDLPHNAIKAVKNIELKQWDFNYNSCDINFDLEMNNKDFNRLAYCYLIENKKTDTRAFKILKKCLRNGYDLQGQELLGTSWVNVEVDDTYYELKDPDSEEIENLYYELTNKIQSSIEDKISNDMRSHDDYYYSLDRFIDDCENNDFLEFDDLLETLEKTDRHQYLKMIEELGI